MAATRRLRALRFAPASGHRGEGFAERRRKLRPVPWRYIAWRYALSFVLFASSFAAILFLAYFGAEIGEGDSAGRTLRSYLRLVFLPLPSVLESALPIIVYFSAIHALVVMEHRGEMTPLRAIGLSDWQILLPIAAGAFLIGLVSLALLNPLAAALVREEADFRTSLEQSGQLSLGAAVTERGFWIHQSDEQATTLMRIAQVRDGELYEGITVLRLEGGETAELISAERARLAPGHWVLEEAWRAERGGQPVYAPRLRLPAEVTRATLRRHQDRPEAASLARLPELIRLRQRMGAPAESYRYRFHNLIAGPSLLAAMTIMAGVFALRPWRRRGRGLWFAAVIAALLVFYALADISRAFSVTLDLPVLFAVWGPIGVCVFLCLAVLGRADHA